MAGSKNVLELHGSTLRNYCMDCGKSYDIDYIESSKGVPKCECGGIIKPDVVLYEEMLNDDTITKSVQYISNADVLIIGGTSLKCRPCYKRAYRRSFGKSENMKVYYMNVKSINADDEKWFKYLSQKRIEKVNRLKKANKKSQSIGAELLLNYAVNGDIKKTVKWDTENGGKLYLTQNKDLYVNLSHSGGYAVCAVHNKDVGIDIQHLRECDMNLAKRFFTAEETEYINCSADKNNAFFEVWTKKESFVKAIGTGLTIPLDSFSVLSDTIRYDGKTYCFKEYSVGEDDYKMFVCYLS